MAVNNIQTAKGSEQYSAYKPTVIKAKSTPISKITRVKSSETIPFVVHAIPKPTHQSLQSINTLPPNSPLKNTFGNVDRKSLREKRKDANFKLRKGSDSVGYTKFTMKGVDVLYSFPKPNLAKATKRKKKQVTTFRSKSQDATFVPYVDYDVEDDYIGRHVSTFTFLQISLWL